MLNETNREFITVYEGISVDIDYKQGDATKETEKWNDDYAYFVNLGNSFFICGTYCYSTSNVGVFSFSRGNGHSSRDISFHICLVV